MKIKAGMNITSPGAAMRQSWRNLRQLYRERDREATSIHATRKRLLFSRRLSMA